MDIVKVGVIFVLTLIMPNFGSATTLEQAEQAGREALKNHEIKPMANAQTRDGSPQNESGIIFARIRHDSVPQLGEKDYLHCTVNFRGDVELSGTFRDKPIQLQATIKWGNQLPTREQWLKDASRMYAIVHSPSRKHSDEEFKVPAFEPLYYVGVSSFGYDPRTKDQSSVGVNLFQVRGVLELQGQSQTDSADDLALVNKMIGTIQNICLRPELGIK